MQAATNINMEESTTIRLRHSDECSSIFLRSVYDKTCPRCQKIGIVIQLKRKTTNNGCSWQEADAARQVASLFSVKFDLKGAELIDRLYVSATNKIVAPSAQSRARYAKRKLDINDLIEGD